MEGEIFVELATRLGVPGAMLWAVVQLGRPMIATWAARENARTYALETTVDAVKRILGELRALRGEDQGD